MTEQPPQPLPEESPAEPVKRVQIEPLPADDTAPEAAPPISAAAPIEEAPAEAPPAEPAEREPEAATPTVKAPTKAPPRKEHYTLVAVVSALRALSVTFAAAVIVATIFMWFTSPEFLSAQTQRDLGRVQATDAQIAAQPTAVPPPAWHKHVGVVAGHSGIATYGSTKGNHDPGTVCPDGFNEAGVTMNVARQVVADLQGRGFEADLLEEFDLRLDNYKADAFISLHADACDNFDDGYNHSGFKDSYPVERFTARDQDLQFDQCIRQYYGAATGLPFTPGGITDAMMKYHAFHTSQGHDGIAGSTPALILELGMLSYDRDLLQNHTDLAARGVVNGLLCFLDPTTLATSIAPTFAPNVEMPTPGLPTARTGLTPTTKH